MMSMPARDHGGGLDAAVARFGGERADWLDLSTGINPVSYPTGNVPAESWANLPDSGAMDHLLAAARTVWQVPDAAQIAAAPGASALIARIPAMLGNGSVHIPGPTYNEHAAAFAAQGWTVTDRPSPDASVQVLVHPNNPDGRLADPGGVGVSSLTIVDESFCDVMPDASFIGRTAASGVLVLKSFGKFWGLAGLRLGFAIGEPALIGQLADMLGPWPVSGPALHTGARALADTAWADTTRTRLADDAGRLDALMSAAGAIPIGGTTLFRLYETENAAAWQARLARYRVWSRIFPYSQSWLRLGLPHPDRWAQVENAISCAETAGADLPGP